MLALILIVWKRRWFYLAYQMLRKKIENDKYALRKCFFLALLTIDRNKKKNIYYYIISVYSGKTSAHRDRLVRRREQRESPKTDGKYGKSR